MTKMPINNKWGNNTARNKTTAVHKYMPDELIVQIATSNETRRSCYFDQSLRPRAAGHSQIERRFIYSLINYTAFVPTVIRIKAVKLGHILPLCSFQETNYISGLTKLSYNTLERRKKERNKKKKIEGRKERRK